MITGAARSLAASVAAASAEDAGSLAGLPGTGWNFVLDLVPNIVWVAAPGGGVVYVNRRAAEYTGLPAGTLHGTDHSWLDVLHPDDVGRTLRDWAEAVRSGSELRADYRIRGAEGSYRWHRAHGVPARADDGGVVWWIGTCTDIDAQRLLEEELRQAQREAAETRTLLEALQSTAPVGFGFVDRQARFVRVNETLAAINGVSVEQHLGRTIAEVVPAIGAQIEPCHRQVLLTGKPVLRTDVTVSVGDDRMRSWLVSCYPVRLEGEVVGVGVVVVDVTEHRQALEFRSVVMDHLAEGLYTTDDQGIVTSINRAGARMLGWQAEELLGRGMHEVVHSRRPDGTAFPAAECPLVRIRAGGEPIQIADDVYVRKDGSLLSIAYSAASLHVGSHVGGVVVVFRDITEERRQQRRQIEAGHDQKLESLGRLSAGLAHEINTPIQFVGDNTRFLAEAYQQMLELLLVYRECLGPNSGQLSWHDRQRRAQDAEEKADIEYLAAEVPSAVEQSLEGTERVASLVRAMKAFSYKDSKERAYADLNEAIRTTATVARNEVKYVADVVLDLGDLPDVLCHAGDLNQVFLNLLVNAADAMQDRGERGEIRVSTRLEDDRVVIRFADNGCGIPEHLLATIFEPFFTTKEVGKGTGQGLALARAVCEKHGGTIDVHSAAGQGTEFVLRLPLAGKRREA